VTDPVLNIDAKRFVLDDVPANRLVVVALVPVAFIKVKFWRVDDPVARRLARVVRPLETLRVPLNDAAELMFWLLIRPDVITPAVRAPTFPLVEKRLVLDAVFANELDDVEFPN
jgi:hypothetical protein